MAIACLRLFTFFPERPLRSVPAFRFFMARFTFLAAPSEYFRFVAFFVAFLAMSFSVPCRNGMSGKPGQRGDHPGRLSPPDRASDHWHAIIVVYGTGPRGVAPVPVVVVAVARRPA